MTISSAPFRHDVVFLQEHFASPSVPRFKSQPMLSAAPYPPFQKRKDGPPTNVGAVGATKALRHQPLLLLGNLECGTASVGAGLVSAGRGCAVEFAAAVGDQTGLRTCAVGTGAERV
jgi:hypothetical protein